MKSLSNISTTLSISEAHGNLGIPVQQITFDSRKVSNDYLFIAVRGTQVDGHRFIDKAIEKGATAIICEELPETLNDDVTYLKVPNSAEAAGLAANRFFDEPSSKLKLVGITGTNGKTTTATLLYKLYKSMGYKTGLLSTVEHRIDETIVPSTHTTPNPIELNELLNSMVEAGCEYAFMEVSSHAIHQHRIAGLEFVGGVFTNISHDHLDYHKTFKEYIYTKKKFFDQLNKNAFALTNIDDRRGEVMVQNTKATIHEYSLKKLAAFKAKIIDNSITGLHLELDGNEFFSRLIGEFNAYNLLAVYATAMLLNSEKLETLTALSKLKSAEGRFDYILSPSKKVIGIVDYAHTPDALEKVLMTIERLRNKNEQVITVVGCGGDRDKKKRPIMAKIACNYSDHVIITSDNPRTENPDTIISEMEKGIPPFAVKKVLSITNRKQAIKAACRLAQQGDIILVAGKGHEKYQEINGVKHPFDDKIILKEELSV